MTPLWACGGAVDICSGGARECGLQPGCGGHCGGRGPAGGRHDAGLQDCPPTGRLPPVSVLRHAAGLWGLRPAQRMRVQLVYVRVGGARAGATRPHRRHLARYG